MQLAAWSPMAKFNVTFVETTERSIVIEAETESEAKAKAKALPRSHGGTKPHLAYLQVEEQQEALGLDRPLGVQSEADGEILIPDAPGV